MQEKERRAEDGGETDDWLHLKDPSSGALVELWGCDVGGATKCPEKTKALIIIVIMIIKKTKKTKKDLSRDLGLLRNTRRSSAHAAPFLLSPGFSIIPAPTGPSESLKTQTGVM